jgi:hypothetical protein
MGWVVGIGLVVIGAVVFWIVQSGRAKAQHAILLQLRPGVRFKARDNSGATIVGECVKVTDSNTVEAFYTKGSGSRREKGTVPIRKIFDVGP